MIVAKSFLQKFRFAAFWAALVLVAMASTAIAARANVVYCMSNYGSCEGGRYGETFWLSCGSSAGNYFALCPADGGPCTVDQGFTQQEADRCCANAGNC